MHKNNVLNVCFFILSISLFSGAVQALSLQNVSHQPKYLDFKTQSQVVINYSLDDAANVVLKIFDDRELLINEIKSSGLQAKGMNSLIWKGDDFAGRRVPAEAYKYTLVASNANQQVEHDLSDLTGGDVVPVYQLKWDKEHKRITYKVLKPSRVNVRVGMKDNGPLMATLADWLPRGHGEHVINWDGFDNSGVFDLNKVQVEDVQVYAEAFTLSTNTILVGPDVDTVNLIENISWKKQTRTRKKSVKPSMKNHSQQYVENRGDFKVDVILPEGLKKSADGAFVVKDIVPVRFVLKNNDDQRIINDRYEPILFIDGKYFVENEVGFFPMTWNLDTSLLTEGEHFLTINLRGYNGHLGSASVKVFVDR